MKLQRGHVPPSPVSGGNTLAGGNGDGQFIRLNLLRALQLHRRLALGCALAGLTLALAYTVKLWPVYTAKSQIYVQPVQQKVMSQGNDQTGPTNAAAYDSYIQQQVQNASNPAVLLSALHKLGPGAWQGQKESEQAAAERLGRAIEAARVGTGYEVAITAKAADPVSSARIANAVANSIVERASGDGNAGDAQRIAVLREERDRIQNELKADYVEQDALNKQLGMAAVGTATPDLIDDQIAKTRDELIKAQTDHDQAEARFSAMKAGQSDRSAAIDAEADDLVAADAGLTSMKTSLNQRRAILITQMANLTPSNPEYKLHAAELAKIQASLDTMMNDLRAGAAARIQQKLRTDLERTAGVEAQLNGQLRELARTAATATPKLQRVNDLATDIVRLRARYSTVDEQLHNLLLEDSAPGAVHLSLAAVPPLHPTISGILKKALPFALGGILLGLLAAVIANKLDPRVYIAADIEETLGFAPMSVLPDFNEVSDGVASEHLLRLAAAIEHARKQGNLKSCIFTGTAHGTGVTTVAKYVRDFLAAMGRSTVLLDATGSAPPDSSLPGQSSDEFGTQRGSRSTALLKQVAAEAEVGEDNLVLADTAPLAVSAETEYLARSVDSAIVVVESGVTTRAQLLAAVNTLQRLEVSAVGFVLNRVGLAKADPAFRHSLRDMEKHLRNQSASSSMWPVRSRGFVDEPASQAEHVSSQGAASEEWEPAQETAAQHPASTVFEWPKTVPESHPAPTTAPPDEAEMPWWLLDAPLPAQPTPAVACVPRPVERVVSSAPGQNTQPPRLPKWFWEGGSSGSGDFTQLPPAEEVERDNEENPIDAESRLHGLRGLFVNLGLTNLSRNKDFASQDEPPPANQQSVSEPPVLHRAAMPYAAPHSNPSAPVEMPPAQAKQVAAKPEFLSPREFVPVKDANRASGVLPKTSWEDDEIRILPARRGQYRSR